jgi:nicotinate phosphoribosyltransferase
MISALCADFYALTMAQGFWKTGQNNRAVFEMFFRRQPFGGGFSIFAGLKPFLDALCAVRFSAEDIAYLRSLQVFGEDFLQFLSAFRFSGSLYSLDEGTVVFPHEPLIRVEGSLIECQLIEGMLLNIINFQTLIATKMARIWLASGEGTVMEFGLRRAQGLDGALSASRAAFIGGAAGTSNVLAGKLYGIPVMGTMAHAWVMAFPNEEEAFEAYAALYPERSVFLIDTYNTLKSGVPAAITVGKRLLARGRNCGVRLDSGDIHYLSVEVRKMLDAAGLVQATITVSNDLDESIIQTLMNAGAPINSWGVGTQLVTGGTDPALSGVYKLTAYAQGAGKFIPTIKFSDNPEKTTTPGAKQVWRIIDKDGMALADVLSLVDSAPLLPGTSHLFWHPSADYRHFRCTITGSVQPLLQKRIDKGERVASDPSLEEIRQTVRRGLAMFDSSYKRFLNPHVYKVSITSTLRDLKLALLSELLG